jgi:tripartite-type tricarboxylate transporter receptor subunit TctC
MTTHASFHYMKRHVTNQGDNMKRRTLIAGLCLAAITSLPISALAQGKYPDRPIKITVGFAAGSSTDAATRVVATKLSQALKQPVVVENRPGASSTLAAKAVGTSTPDGYNLLVATIANAINANAQGAIAFDVAKNLSPIGMLGRVPNVLVVPSTLGVASLDDLIRLGKSKPGELTYASSGNGTAPHLAGVLFGKLAEVDILHVPYKGSSEAMTDLLAGRVSMMFSPASTVLPHIRAGKLKALASTGPKRSPVVPDLPTISELGLKEFESSVWFGLVAPLGTPADIQATLANAVQAALDSPEVKSQLMAQGIEVVKAGPQEFGQYLRAETDKWGKVIQGSGVKLN